LIPLRFDDAAMQRSEIVFRGRTRESASPVATSVPLVVSVAQRIAYIQGFRRQFASRVDASGPDGEPGTAGSWGYGSGTLEFLPARFDVAK
jgi:hypothetical protein